MAPKASTNAPAPRMVECICLHPMCDFQGGHIVHDLHTKKIAMHHTATPIPLSPQLMQMIDSIGLEQGMTKIVFQRLIWDSSLIAGVDCIKNENDSEDEDEDCVDEQEDNKDLLCDEEDKSIDDGQIPIDDRDEESNQAEGPQQAGKVAVTDNETEDAVTDEDTNEVLTAGVDEDEDIRNAGLEQAATDLDDLMQPMEE